MTSAKDQFVDVRHHRDLRTWQKAETVRRAIIELCSKPAVQRDFAFRDQALRAAGSACRNIAEGFWRFKHKEFAYFVNIAIGSLGELLDLADEALARQYCGDAEHRALASLIEPALASAKRLHHHLDTTPTPARPAG